MKFQRQFFPFFHLYNFYQNSEQSEETGSIFVTSSFCNRTKSQNNSSFFAILFPLSFANALMVLHSFFIKISIRHAGSISRCRFFRTSPSKIFRFPLRIVHVSILEKDKGKKEVMKKGLCLLYIHWMSIFFRLWS